MRLTSGECGELIRLLFNRRPRLPSIEDGEALAWFLTNCYEELSPLVSQLDAKSLVELLGHVAVGLKRLEYLAQSPRWNESMADLWLESLEAVIPTHNSDAWALLLEMHGRGVQFDKLFTGNRADRFVNSLLVMLPTECSAKQVELLTGLGQKCGIKEIDERIGAEALQTLTRVLDFNEEISLLREAFRRSIGFTKDPERTLLLTRFIRRLLDEGEHGSADEWLRKWLQWSKEVNRDFILELVKLQIGKGDVSRAGFFLNHKELDGVFCKEILHSACVREMGGAKPKKDLLQTLLHKYFEATDEVDLPLAKLLSESYVKLFGSWCFDQKAFQRVGQSIA